MKDQLITLETAKLANNKNFDIDCDFKIDPKSEYHFCCDLAYPNNSEFTYDPENDPEVIEFHQWRKTLLEAPTQSLLQKWLREIHKIDIQILRNKPGYNEYKVEIYKTDDTDTYMHFWIKENGYIIFYDTYEEALECGLSEALKLIKI
jgi:hypothetical protein